MKSKAKISTINNLEILVQPFNSEPTENSSSCASGSCESCSKYSRKRLIQVLNPNDLPIGSGDIVELEIASKRVFIGLLRVLIIPMIFFAGFYLITKFSFNAEEQVRTLSGVSGFILALSVNFLFRKKNPEKEKPAIIRVL